MHALAFSGSHPIPIAKARRYDDGMLLFEWTLALLLGAVLVAGLARRLEVPYPALLALAGAGLAFLPFAPTIEIEPDLALALFVAPVLLDAAFDTSPRDLNAMRCRSLRWQSSR